MRDLIKAINHFRKGILLLIGLLVIYVSSAQSNVRESTSGFLTSMPPEAPVLSEPADQAADLPVDLSLGWFSQIHTRSFTIQLSDSPDLTNPFIDQAGLSDTVYIVSALAHDNTYYWHVRASNVAGDGPFSEIWSFSTTSTTPIGTGGNAGMNGFSLDVNPNPFNSKVRIEYQLPEETDVLLTVYNSVGQAVQLLDAGLKPAGKYQSVWNGKESSGERAEDGVYFFLLQTNAGVVTRKIILIR